MAPHQPASLGDENTLYSQRNQGEDSSLASARPLWREKFDKEQVYRIDKHFAYVHGPFGRFRGGSRFIFLIPLTVNLYFLFVNSMTDPRMENFREIKRWRDNDIKGNRERYYTKEVYNKNASIMTIVEQSRLERNFNYTDGHKCLNLRKRLMRFQIHVNEACTAFVSHRLFEGFIILVIGLNCITLASADSTKEETEADKTIDLVFNIVYTIEMVLRIMSMGFFFGSGAYLKNYWCMLDFICVTTAYMEVIGGGGGSFGALRAFRVLRPLRFVNNIAGLKAIVSSIMKAIPVL